MQSTSITADRVNVALEQIKPTDGAFWEGFANSFLASDIPQLRPIGGMHDQGRDAFLYEIADEPGVFVQHSVQLDFETKITDTLKTLRKNGFNPHQIIYCTPHDIIKQVDGVKRKLRQEHVALDVRDRQYFITFRNTSSNRIAVCEDAARKLVDPLLRTASPTESLPHLLSDEEERTALAYFQISVDDRVSEKSLIKLCYETLVRFALKQATPEKPVGFDGILTSIRRLVPNEQLQHLTDKVKGTLSRLTSKGIVKHHTKPDAYTLSKSERDALFEKMQTLLSEHSLLTSEAMDIASRTAEALEIDYSFDARCVAEDALLLCDFFLLHTGRGAAKAFEAKVFFNPAIATLSDFAKKLSETHAKSLKSLGDLGLAKFLDLVPHTAERILKQPTDTIARYFSRVGDSYYLLFVLRQSPEVIQVVEKVVGRSQLLLDANTIVPCMAEILLPEDQRRMTMLFATALDLGVKLHVGQEAINELLAVIKKARAIFISDQARGFHYGTSGLVEAYERRSKDIHWTFNEFLEQFAGPENPIADLKLFLKHHLGIDFVALEAERGKIDPGHLEEVAAELKPARKSKQTSQEMEDVLVKNDVTCLLLIELLRRRENANDALGFSWWWLTSDRVAYGIDRRRNSPGACACMSPDFLLRYLSIQPRHSAKQNTSPLLHLPLAVEVAAVGFVPAELKEAVEAELTDAESLPKYMRIRKIRDTLNSARAPLEIEAA